MSWCTPLVRGIATAFFSLPPAIAGAGALPLVFESNLGQTDARVRFLTRGQGFTLFLTPEEIVASGAAGQVRLRLRGAAARPVIEGLEPLPGKSNYIQGGGKRVRGVPQFARVRYRDLYPGIHLVFYGDRKGIEFDLELAAGADPNRIGIEFEGATPAIDADGSLVAGALRLAAPRAFQGGAQIAAAFVLDVGGHVSFRLGEYDYARALRIDPILSYSTYLGGDTAASGGNDYIRSIATDAYGNVYVAGATESPSFPTYGVQAPPFRGTVWNTFFAKFAPDGAPVYCTYFQGDNLYSEASALAIDREGSLYVTGYSYNGSFPATPGAYQSQRVNARDVFVLKLNPEGGIIYATLLGGEGDDYGTAIVVDDAGQATVAGSTASARFPITEGAVQGSKTGFSVPFVARFSADGTKLLFSTYLGGQGDIIQALAFDVNRELLVAGQVTSDLLPSSADALRAERQYQDGFLLRLSDNGSTVLYSTYIGGASTDTVRTMRVDAAGSIWLAGSTYSWDLPVSENADQKKLAGVTDAFLMKLDPAGKQIQHLTYFGGKEADAATAIEFDAADFIYLAGETSSGDLPAVETAVQPAYGGGVTDAFLAIFDADVKRTSSTYLGGGGEERVTGLVLDPAGDAWLGGNTLSADFATTDTAFRRTLSSGGWDGFLARLGSLATARVHATYIGGGGSSRNEQALDVVVDSAGSAYVTGTSYSTNFPTTQGTYLAAPAGGPDAFISKFDPQGKTLLFSTYIGGTGQDNGAGIALAPDGSIWLVGTTNSRDFPVTEGAPQAKLAGNSLDAWFARLSSDGSQLLFSTYFGGLGTEQYAAIAVHSSGDVFVAGSSSSGDLPVTADSYQTAPGSTDVFALRLTTEGQLAWVARAGGAGGEVVYSAAVDSSGRLLVGGSTASQDFPATPGSFQTARGGSDDGFVLQFEADGRSLAFASYVGGGNNDQVRRVALDPAGNILIAGYTNSPSFPTTPGVIRTALAGGEDGFVVKLKPGGSEVAWSTLLGSTSTDRIYALASDAQSNVIVAGYTYSGGFPVSPTTSVQNINRGNGDGFISRILPDATAMSYSSFLGGTGTDIINSVALDSTGNPIVVGQTCSTDFPVMEAALQPAIGGPCNALVVKTDFSVPTPPRNPPQLRSVEHFVLGTPELNPGMIFRIKGVNLAKSTATAATPGQPANGALPTSLGGAAVTFSPNLPVPLFSVSPTEIVGQVPYGAPSQTVLTVSTADGIAQRQFIISFAPQWGLIGVYKSDMSPITAQSRISPGDTMIVHVIGGVLGAGSRATEGIPVPASPVFDQFAPTPMVLVRSIPAPTGGGMNCELVSIKLLPGYIGVAEVRVKMPSGTSTATGEAEVFMFVGSGISNTLRIYQPPVN